MNDILKLINQNSNLILAFLTAVYVVFTYRILKANKGMLEANRDLIKFMVEENEKNWRPYILIRTYDKGFINCLLIKNVGKSAAENVKFKLKEGVEKKISSKKTKVTLQNSLLKNED